VPDGFVDGYYDRALNLLRTGVYGGGADASVYAPHGLAFYPPGYSFLLYVSILLFGEGSQAVFVPNLALFIATVCVLRLALKAAGIRYYNAYTLLLLVSAGRFFFHFIPVSDAVGSYFAVAAIAVLALALRWPARAAALAFVSGLLLGWDILVRVNAVLFIVPLVAMVVGLSAYQRTRLVLAGLVVLGTALPVGAWSIRNYTLFHEPFVVTTNGGYNLFIGNNDSSTVLWDNQEAEIQAQTAGMSELERDRTLSHLAMSWIEQHPTSFAVLATEKLGRAFASDTAAISNLQDEMDTGRVSRVPDAVMLVAGFLANSVYYAMLVLFAAHVWRLGRDICARWLEAGVTLLLCGSTALPVALTFGLARYRDFFFYLMLLSISGLLERLSEVRSTSRATVVVDASRRVAVQELARGAAHPGG
jgi:hypothetical protein